MCTNFFGWNVRGFNISNHRSGFKKWFKSNKPIFGGLIETHVKQPKNIKFISELLPGWSFEDNYSFSELGKIWVLWHPSVIVDIISKSLQMITCDVKLPDSQSSIVVSITYASTDEDLRKVLWQELICTSLNQRVQGKAWLVLGDFNQVLYPHENSKSLSSSGVRKAKEFSKCLQESDLSDLTFKGNTFTWWNKRQNDPIAKKLDRALVNDLWYSQFPSSYAVFGEPDFSDHAACEIILSSVVQRQIRPFKFFNFLLQNNEFLHLVAENWYSSNVAGTTMYRVSTKLQSLKKQIREFSKSNYSDIENRVKEAHVNLLAHQNQVLADPSEFNAVAVCLSLTKV